MEEPKFESYIAQTEPAVRHLFLGLAEYDSIYSPSINEYIDETGKVKMTKEQADFVVGSASNYFSYEFSRATLAGSILQIVYMGIKLFSNNQAVSKLCKEEIGVTSKCSTLKFCVGREIHDLPLGLYVYAGRNQYNHWEEGDSLYNITKKVFRHLELVYYDDPTCDINLFPWLYKFKTSFTFSHFE